MRSAKREKCSKTANKRARTSTTKMETSSHVGSTSKNKRSKTSTAKNCGK